MEDLPARFGRVNIPRMDAASWLAVFRWMVLAGGLLTAVSALGVWYFGSKVHRPPPPVIEQVVVTREVPAAPREERTAAPALPAVIESLELHVTIEAPTPTRPVAPVEVKDGPESVVTVFMEDRTQIRFVSDGKIHDEQAQPTRRRLTFVYRPAEAAPLVGREIELLRSIQVMAVDYREIFRKVEFAADDQPTRLRLAVSLNGVEASGLADQAGAPGLLAGTQAVLDISEAFADLPARYAAALRARARP